MLSLTHTQWSLVVSLISSTALGAPRYLGEISLPKPAFVRVVPSPATVRVISWFHRLIPLAGVLSAVCT